MKWFKKVEFTVSTTPQEREMSMGYEFDCDVKVDISITNGFLIRNRVIRQFKSAHPARNTAMLYAFQDFLDGNLYSQEIKYYDHDCRTCPPIQTLETIIACDDPFLKQLISEMFGEGEIITESFQLTA